MKWKWTVFQNDNKAVILSLYDLKAIPLTNTIYKQASIFDIVFGIMTKLFVLLTEKNAVILK